MNSYDEDFLKAFNECYPFERYIFKGPKPLGMTFDDVLLTEIFVPYTEIKPMFNEDGSFSRYTKIPYNEVFVKVIGNAGEMRIGYLDFEEHIRENIRDIFIVDFGKYEYECLYVDHEEEGNASLIEVLNTQKALIKEKYGECHIKTSLRDKLINE